MMSEQTETQKPSFFLYLMAKFSIAVFPLALLMNVILIKLGMSDDFITLTLATIISYYISEWYEELNNEIFLYLLEKHSKEMDDA